MIRLREFGLALSAVAISVFGFGTQGLSPAGGVPTVHIPSGGSTIALPHASPRTNVPGFYELIVIKEGAHVDVGQMTVNVDGTWTIPNAMGGIWTTSNKAVAFSEFAFPPKHWVFLGTLTKQGFSSVKKPGSARWFDGTFYISYPWYAVRKKS